MGGLKRHACAFVFLLSVFPCSTRSLLWNFSSLPSLTGKPVCTVRKDCSNEACEGWSLVPWFWDTNALPSGNANFSSCFGKYLSSLTFSTSVHSHVCPSVCEMLHIQPCTVPGRSGRQLAACAGSGLWREVGQAVCCMCGSVAWNLWTGEKMTVGGDRMRA